MFLWGVKMPKYFTINERMKIETMLDNGFKPKEIAKYLNRHFTSVYREIKRGSAVLLNSDLLPYTKYCADVGQRKMVEASKNKGVDLKIKNDFKTVKFIENCINDKKYSPYVISLKLGLLCGYTPLSKGTIYNYIYRGLFLNVDRSCLSYKARKKPKAKDKTIVYNKSDKTFIDERPKEINRRDSFGHWELDTVYSGKDMSKECLLVFTERFTRYELIYKLKNRTAQAVLDLFNRLEKSIGFDNFKNTFKSITCDNGVEFSYHKQLEKSCINVDYRTRFYFCHPFNSCERGSNENANKLIRKFIPKGFDIGLCSDTFIMHIQDFINNYPRLLFKGLSSNQIINIHNISLCV
jgi:IS30 family transposase